MVLDMLEETQFRDGVGLADDPVVAEACDFLAARGYILDHDFTVHTAVTFASEIVWRRGWGPGAHPL